MLSDLSATGKIPFYERRGDQNGYLGYRYRHDLRYQFNYNRKIFLQEKGSPPPRSYPNFSNAAFTPARFSS